VDDILNAAMDGSQGGGGGRGAGSKAWNPLLDIVQMCATASGLRPQTILFSATIGDDDNDPEDIKLNTFLQELATRQHVLCKALRKDVAGMTHLIIRSPNDETKKKVLAYLMSDTVLLGSAIVFCKAKDRASCSIKGLMHMDPEIRMRDRLEPLRDGDPFLTGVQEFHAGAEITYEQRIKMMSRFRKNQARILVATDAVAKGIDVPNVTMVVQMELVKSGGCKGGFSWLRTENKALDQFRHRSGRTARALQKGINVVMIDANEEELATKYMRVQGIAPDNFKVVHVDESGRVDDSLRTFIEAAQH
jgi:superfamily II DNA/RNA helicase